MRNWSYRRLFHCFNTLNLGVEENKIKQQARYDAVYIYTEGFNVARTSPIKAAGLRATKTATKTYTVTLIHTYALENFFSAILGLSSL